MARGAGFFGVPEGKPNPYLADEPANLERGLKYLLETDVRAELVLGASSLVLGAEQKHMDGSESNAPSTKHQAPSTRHQALASTYYRASTTASCGPRTRRG